jgi:trk system potassium uptake protein TrkA
MEALRKVDFLRILPNDRLEELAVASHSRIYGAGEVVFAQGDLTAEMFIIESGEVVVQVGQSKSQEVARLGSAGFFGEMALMTGEARNATVVATRPCTLIGVDDKAMRRVFAAVPELAQHVSQVIAERQAALASLPTETVDQRRADVEERSSVLLERIRRFFSL